MRTLELTLSLRGAIRSGHGFSSQRFLGFPQLDAGKVVGADEAEGLVLERIVGRRRDFLVVGQRRRRRPVLLGPGYRRILAGDQRRLLLLQVADIQLGLGLVQLSRGRLAGGDAAQVLGRLDEGVRVVVGVAEFGRYEG